MLHFTDDNIVQITKDEIVFATLYNETKIRFSECKKNFATEHFLNESNCVGTRDITVPAFIFYSQPKIKVTFKRRHLLQELFSKRPLHKKFNILQQTLQKLGYTTYDLS